MSQERSPINLSKDLAALLAEAVETEDFDFELKAEEVAVNLSSLMIHAGLTRADLARNLDWKPARVSKVLGGKENLTLRTLYAVFKALGYTFDVVARLEADRAPMQPWQRISYSTRVVASRDMKLRDMPTVTPLGHRPEVIWPTWPTSSQKKSYSVDLTKAANTDQYNAALAS